MRLDIGFVLFTVYASVVFGLPDEAASNFQYRHVQRRSSNFFQDLKLTLASLIDRDARRLTRRHSSLHKRGVATGPGKQCIAKQHTLGPPTSPADGGGSGIVTVIGSKTTTVTATRTTTKKAPTPTSTSTSGSNYKQVFDAAGDDFFDSWTFWSDGDPTNGVVDYTTQEEAQSNKLIEINSDGHAIMRVETTPEVTGFRKGVRIHSRSSFNGGLWLADVVHMPVGCATWPAFWTHGPGWPNAGEIDILEGVNENSFNQAALHTASGCTLPADFGATGVSATGPNCAALETGNSGCGIRSVESNTYGAGFNENGGGVYAMLWDESAVSIWFFPRGSIPKDVSSSSPQPASWGKPAARWPADTCDPYQFNKDHITIFNTALCGDWAGTSWNASPNGGGPSCAAKTGVATCQEYVQKNGAAFAEAYWQVKNVKIFQK